MENLDQVIFYKIETAIKSYRQFAQKSIRDAGYSMTIDQWLTIAHILENPDIKQQDLADGVFKDSASVTRIIELLVKAKYLKRTVNKDDRRRTKLTVTPQGREVVAAVTEVVLRNRELALAGIEHDDLLVVDRFLKSMTDNCRANAEGETRDRAGGTKIKSAARDR